MVRDPDPVTLAETSARGHLEGAGLGMGDEEDRGQHRALERDCGGPGDGGQSLGESGT